MQALHTARIKEVAVIEALAKIGQLVKNKAQQKLGKNGNIMARGIMILYIYIYLIIFIYVCMCEITG